MAVMIHAREIIHWIYKRPVAALSNTFQDGFHAPKVYCSIGALPHAVSLVGRVIAMAGDATPTQARSAQRAASLLVLLL
ncbi:hypothetical protein GQ56_0135520 [Burkholderia paludis]|nr:hypothetical protein GQ56_0135520 [Burkholderia paludis]